jgi:hypothetical protein
LSALLRIADGLDRRHESRVKEMTCTLPRAKGVFIRVCSPTDLKVELEAAQEKAKLMSEVFNVETIIQQDNSQAKTV